VTSRRVGLGRLVSVLAKETALNTVLWILQVGLAATFTASGIAKSTLSKPRLVETGQTGVAHFSLGFIRFIATCELTGAVGLIVPWATGSMPWLTPLAAACLGVIMIGAASAHARLAREHRQDPGRRRRSKELWNMTTALMLLLLCGSVTVGRLEPFVLKS
jgi:hypothetical protein